MTSRARLLTALKGMQPDRVPVVVSRNLFAKNAFTREKSYGDMVKHARAYSDVMFKEHVGTLRYLDMYPRYGTNLEVEIQEPEDGETIVVMHTRKGALTKVLRSVPGTAPEVLRVTTKYFIEEEEDFERFLSIPYEPGDIGVEQVQKSDLEVGDRGLVLVTMWDAVGAAVSQIDPEQFALWSVTKKYKLRGFVDIMHERIKNELSLFLHSGVGDVFYFNGPEYVIPPSQPPSFFNEFVVPYDAELIKMIHEYSRLAMVHCHGKVSAFIKRFYEMGVDALHPLEPPPSGDVDIGKTKTEFDNKFCIVGNIQYSELTNYTPEEIFRRVKQLIQDAGKGGALIVSPCSGLYEIPIPERTAENYKAMIDAVLKYGFYS